MRLHLGISRILQERCASWGAQDAAHGASDNELVIRRGLEPREPSRAPLDRSCLLSPACPTFVLFGFFFRFRVERGEEIRSQRSFILCRGVCADWSFLFQHRARMRG